MRSIGHALCGTALLITAASSAFALPMADSQPFARPESATSGVVLRDDPAPGVVLADGPPPWAPAHGYRRKHGKSEWKRDAGGRHHHHDDDEFGIGRGFCNRELIGGILGGVTGGALGSQIGDGRTNTAATIGGTIVGVLVGGAIGRHMDEADRACAGHAVAYGKTLQPVAWDGADGRHYRVRPLSAAYTDSNGRTCRSFETIVIVGDAERSERATACRRSDGSWRQAG